MIDIIYTKMAVPDSCFLGKRIFKRLFLENAKLTAADKKAFRDDIYTITWQYTLKPITIQILAYEDDQREYHEVAILQVDMKTFMRTNRIAEIIHRAIPYPLIVVFSFENSCALSVAHKRFSQAEKEAIVADEFHSTDWIDLANPSAVQKDFINSISVLDLPQTHFYAFYSAFVDRIIALECARLTGEYRIEPSGKVKSRRADRLTDCIALEMQIAELRTAIKKETQFNRKVELNIKMKKLEQELEKKTAFL